MCIVIICCPAGDVINFGLNLAFFSSRFFAKPKNQDKNLNEFLLWNEKHFPSFLKGSELLEIASDPTVDL